MELWRVVCAQGTSVPAPPVFLEENKAFCEPGTVRGMCTGHDCSFLHLQFSWRKIGLFVNLGLHMASAQGSVNGGNLNKKQKRFPVFLEENKAVDFRQFLAELMYLVMIRNLE